MDGASAGVTGGAAACFTAVLLSASASAAPVAAAANAAALSAAAAFSAAGCSGGSARMLTLCEAQPQSTTASNPVNGTFISLLPASVRPAYPACRTLAGASRHCRGGHRDHKRQFSNRECLAATPARVYRE